MIIQTDRIADYRAFLRIRQLPAYRFRGSVAEYPAEYAAYVSGRDNTPPKPIQYELSPFLFDYQSDITRMALTKRRFAVFADCGLGKTLIFLEWAKHVLQSFGGRRSVLIVSPLMVIGQTIKEARRWYGDDYPIKQVRAAELASWMQTGDGICITNFEALTDEIPQGRIGALVIDESSMLKSHYGKWGAELIRLGRGLDYKLALTGTPAPNDRIEYANHAVFLDVHPTVNSFLARYFINRGQTENRWEIKPHAVKAFYRDLSAWSIFVSNPAVYGWKAHAEELPPIHVHIHDVPLTTEQRDIVHRETGDLFVNNLGGIASRTRLASVAKGYHKEEEIPTNKVNFIRELVASFKGESTIVWCLYNREQEIIADAIDGCETMTGETSEAERERIIEGFKAGKIRVIVTKPRILGYGLNLQIATRQVFSSLQDSYESYYQAVKRSNRVGSTLPLNVHIPVTDIERPMIDTVLRKAHRVAADTKEQEELFRGCKW